MIATALASAVVLSLARCDRELVGVADQDVGRARDRRVACVRAASGQEIDGAEVVEIERERGDHQRRHGDEEQRQRDAAEDLPGPPPSTRAASVSSCGIDCSAPSETRKKYGVVIQTLTSMHRELGPVAIEQPRHVDAEQPVDDRRSRRSAAPPRRAGSGSRASRTGRSARCGRSAGSASPLSSVIARKRPTANAETVDGREGECPDEDLRNGFAVQRIVDELAEVVEADIRLPARLELVLAVDERAAAVVGEHGAVADPHELVLRRVVAQRRLQLDCLCDALGLDRSVAVRRDAKRASSLSSEKSSAPLISV